MSGPVSAKSSKEKSADQANTHSDEHDHRRVQIGSQSNILTLQQTAGNQAVSQLLDSTSNDQVTEPTDIASEKSLKPLPSAETSVADARTLPSAVRSFLSISSGKPLDPTIRASMESLFGYDFAPVRIHTGRQAAESAYAANARAYTVGRHIVFSETRLASNNKLDKELLAHELAHTIQQTPNLQKPPAHSSSNTSEAAAHSAARSAGMGNTVEGTQPATGIGLACAPITPAGYSDQELISEINALNDRINARANKEAEEGMSFGGQETDLRRLDELMDELSMRNIDPSELVSEPADVRRERKAEKTSARQSERIIALKKKEGQKESNAESSALVGVEKPIVGQSKHKRERTRRIHIVPFELRLMMAESGASRGLQLAAANKPRVSGLFLRNPEPLTSEHVWEWGSKHHIFNEDEKEKVFEARYRKIANERFKKEDIEPAKEEARKSIENQFESLRSPAMPIQGFAFTIVGLGGFYLAYSTADTVVQGHRAIVEGKVGEFLFPYLLGALIAWPGGRSRQHAKTHRGRSKTKLHGGWSMTKGRPHEPQPFGSPKWEGRVFEQKYLHGDQIILAQLEVSSDIVPASQLPKLSGRPATGNFFQVEARTIDATTRKILSRNKHWIRVEYTREASASTPQLRSSKKSMDSTGKKDAPRLISTGKKVGHKTLNEELSKLNEEIKSLEEKIEPLRADANKAWKEARRAKSKRSRGKPLSEHEQNLIEKHDNLMKERDAIDEKLKEKRARRKELSPKLRSEEFRNVWEAREQLGERLLKQIVGEKNVFVKPKIARVGRAELPIEPIKENLTRRERSKLGLSSNEVTPEMVVRLEDGTMVMVDIKGKGKHSGTPQKFVYSRLADDGIGVVVVGREGLPAGTTVAGQVLLLGPKELELLSTNPTVETLTQLLRQR